MTSLKIYLQQSHRCQDFSHNDMSAKGTSYACKCTNPFVWRYKAKHAYDKTQQCRSNFLDFLLFMCFWIFDTKVRKDWSKTTNVKTFKANNKQTQTFKPN